MLSERDFNRAAEMIAEVLRYCREFGFWMEEASALHKQGYLALHQKDIEGGRRLFRQSLALQQEMSNRQGIAEGLFGLACAASQSHQFSEASRLFGAAQAVLDSIGAPLSPADQQQVDGCQEGVRQRLDPQAFEVAYQIGQTEPADQAIAAALGTVA